MKSSYKALLAAVAVVALVAGGWFFLKREEIATVHPHTGPVVDAVYASGTVEPVAMFPLAPKVAGRITQLLADEGDTVARGQILAQLDSSEASANLLELKAKETDAKAQADRATRLLPIGGISKADADSARATYKAAVEARKAAQAQLGYTQLTAMVTSTVVYRDGEIGQLIPANQTVFYLADPTSLRVSVQVDEEDIPEVKTGQTVLIRSDAFPNQSFTGTVSSITPKGDSEARTFRVRVALPANTPLRIGMTVETNIVLRTSDNALLIPTSAVQNGAVWKVVGNRLHKQAITTGVTTPSQTEVLQGLTLSDTLVKTPKTGLKENQKIISKLSK